MPSRRLDEFVWEAASLDLNIGQSRVRDHLEPEEGFAIEGDVLHLCALLISVSSSPRRSHKMVSGAGAAPSTSERTRARRILGAARVTGSSPRYQRICRHVPTPKARGSNQPACSTVITCYRSTTGFGVAMLAAGSVRKVPRIAARSCDC